MSNDIKTATGADLNRTEQAMSNKTLGQLLLESRPDLERYVGWDWMVANGGNVSYWETWARSFSERLTNLIQKEQAMSMTDIDNKLLEIIGVLDASTGDTDPDIDDADMRDEYPEVWAMQQLVQLREHLAKQRESEPVAKLTSRGTNWDMHGAPIMELIGERLPKGEYLLYLAPPAVKVDESKQALRQAAIWYINATDKVLPKRSALQLLQPSPPRWSNRDERHADWVVQCLRG